MREIKFRAWHKEMKLMYRVLSLVLGQREQEASLVRYETTLVRYEGPYVTCHLDEIELLQYTGLKDKNSKEIFEGDILYHDDVRHWPKTVRKMTADKLAKYPREPIIVEWNTERAGFDPFVSEDDEQGPYFYSERIEIAGNIYENPELFY